MSGREELVCDDVAQVFATPKSWEEVKALQIATTKLLNDHQARVARNKFIALHGSTTAARPADWFIAQAEAPKPTTANKYMGRGGKLFQDAQRLGQDVWNLLEVRSGSAGSWNTGKAALQFYLAHRIKEAKRVIDRLAKPGHSRDELRQALVELPALANALTGVPNGLPAKFAPRAGTKVVRKSKSVSVRSASPDWRERVAEAMPAVLQRSWLLQCATGCRPQELANGITVLLREDGRIELSVVGAKVGKRSGQALRSMVIAGSEGALVQMLATRLNLGERLHLRLETSVDAYRKAVARWCHKVFPAEDSRKLLTEPPRVSRRLNTLRGLSHEQVEQVLARGT